MAINTVINQQTKDQAVAFLQYNIKNQIRHVDYERVNEVARQYTAFATGEKIDGLLKQFTPREDEVQFKQRVELTQLVTPDMSNALAVPMYKVARTMASKTIAWNDTAKSLDSKKELDDVTSRYFGNTSVDRYLESALVDFDRMDPNSFIVTEFKGKVNPADASTKAKPYPFEVNSKEAVNYKYINNELQFLVVQNAITFPNAKNKQLEGFKYTLYLADISVTATQLSNELVNAYQANNPDAVIWYVNEKDKVKGDVYAIEVFEHKAGQVPAIRTGHRRDPMTRKRTCVPMIHPAHCYFLKSIKTISEFDLTNTLHTFPKLYTYADVCEGDIDRGITCIGGKVPDGGKCPVCNGSGWQIHKSASDVVKIKMPRTLSEMVSLENFAVYKAPPIDLVKFQKDLGIYEFRAASIKAVYNSELFSADEVAATATEKSIDLDSVYDTLKPFADHFSEVWEHIMLVSAAYRDLDEGLTIRHVFPKDFKMKSVDMLLDDLAKANNSGAPSYVIQEINRDLTNKIYVDRPTEVVKLDVMERFYPFNGKTQAEIQNIILDGLVSKRNKVLYANFNTIFEELDQENTQGDVNFYRMSYDQQKALLNAKLDEYVTQVDADAAAARATTFNGQDAGFGG